MSAPLPGVTARARKLARGAVHATLMRVAAAWRSAAPHAAIAAQPDAVVVRGRDVVRRWLADPELRRGRGSW